MIPKASANPDRSENVPAYMLDDKRRRDNVYDFIDLNQIEREVIDTPEFQRLRQIRQLGFGYLLYQSAEHTRYVHSLGVCHAAKVLVDWINRNHAVAARKPPRKRDQDSPSLFDPSETVLVIPEIRWMQRVCIGLAALLHDLPHPPMSHALEHESSMIARHDNVEQNPQLYNYLFSEHSGISRALAKFSPTMLSYVREHGNSLGLKFGKPEADQFLAANKLEPEKFLGGVIFEILAFKSRERHPGNSFLYCRSWDADEPKAVFYFSRFFRPFFADLISNTICADLIDYLLRDAMNTGVRRAVDLKFLDRLFVRRVPQRFDELRVVFDLTDPRRGIRKDTVSALLGLLESRYDLMERVYMHRTKLAASAMLGRSYYLSAITPSSTLYDADSGDGCPSDDSLLRTIRYGNARFPSVPAATFLAASIANRQIYRPLFIIDDDTCRKNLVVLDRHELIERFRAPPRDRKWDAIIGVERRLARVVAPFAAGIVDKHPFILFCMEAKVAYKDPKVIIEVPSDSNFRRSQETTQMATEDVPSILRLLRDHVLDQGAQSQIASMHANYGGLWKFYVFFDGRLAEDPAFSQRIPQAYAELVHAIGREYPVSGTWMDIYVDGRPLVEKDLADALQAAVPLQASETTGLVSQVAEYLSSTENDAKQVIASAGITGDHYQELGRRFWLQFPRIKYVPQTDADRGAFVAATTAGLELIGRALEAIKGSREKAKDERPAHRVAESGRPV